MENQTVKMNTYHSLIVSYNSHDKQKRSKAKQRSKQRSKAKKQSKGKQSKALSRLRLSGFPGMGLDGFSLKVSMREKYHYPEAI